MIRDLPFADELELIGEDPSFAAVMGGVDSGKALRFKRPITSRENLRRMLSGEKPMWIPMSTDLLTFNPNIFADVRARAMVVEKDRPTEKGGLDFFGVDWEFIPEAGGSMVRPGAPKLPDVNDWEKHIIFPDVDAMDWQGCADRNRDVLEASERAINVTFFNGYFERLISFMDFEDAAVALIDEDCEDALNALFARLTDFYIDLMKRCKHYFNIDILTVHDDWGSQRAPFFSPDVVREKIAPHFKRLSDAAHAEGVLFEQHSCGKIEQLVPVMIEQGIDYWRGQPMNDILAVAKQYGDKMAFGYRIPAVAPGTPKEEIYAVAKKYVDDFAGLRAVAALYGGRDSEELAYLRDCIYALSREYYAK